MTKLLREPLLHFLLLGAALFLVYAFAQQGETAESERQIIVSAGRIDQLKSVYEKTWQRPPTQEELQGLVDDFVLEEAYYRKAVAMGIDRDDTIIRRRMRQKLEFLTDTTSLIEPTDDELAAYLAANQDRFQTSPTYTLQQVYINPDKHKESADTYIANQLKRLRSGETVDGDSALLPNTFVEVSRETLDSTFGAGFSQQLDGLALEEWDGPISSGLGSHLVRLESRTDGRLPQLTEIRNVVEREWLNEKTIANRENMNSKMREEYEVIVQWPSASDEASDPADTL